MNGKEQQRAMALNRVELGRQVRRLLAAYRKEGVADLPHGNRGRQPVHRISEHHREQIVAQARGPYRGLNHCHFQEVVAEREGLVLNRTSLWRILTGAGIPSDRVATLGRTTFGSKTRTGVGDCPYKPRMFSKPITRPSRISAKGTHPRTEGGALPGDKRIGGSLRWGAPRLKARAQGRREAPG